MADIYFPIDSSVAKNVIPPGEEIIYSTLCKIVHSGLPGSGTPTRKWDSHVLLTPKGLVYSMPGNRALYNDWFEVKRITGKYIELFLGFRMGLKREPNFETKDGFKKRSKEFSRKIKPIMQGRKDEWVTRFPKKKERKQEVRKRINEINHLR
jgi:hypothetical protein